MEETTKQEIAKNISKFTDLVIEPVKQRTAHPFISSYLISGLFVNWKAISCLLFSSKIIEDKIKYIEATFYPDESSKTFAIVTPLLIALFYTIVLKWFDVFIDAVNNVPVHYRIVNQAKIKVNTLAAQIDIVKAQIRLNNARAENKELEELNDRIRSLQNDIVTKEEIIKQTVSEVDRFTGRVSELTKTVSLLRAEQNDMAIVNMLALETKSSYESFITILLSEFDEHALNDLQSKMVSANYSTSVKNLLDSAFKKNRYKLMESYKIALIFNMTEEELNSLKMELLAVDENIGIEKTLNVRGGKDVYTLEVYYSSPDLEDEVKYIVNKYVTRQ